MSQAGIISVAGGGGGGSPIQTLTGDTGGPIPPTANNINILGGTGVTVAGTPGTSTLTISVVNEGFTWSEQAVSFAAQIQNGYFCTAALTASLPTSIGLTIGNSIIIYVDTTSPVVIQANTGEFIQVGFNISDAGGTATSNTRGSILELVYRPSDLTWHGISSFGSWSLSGP